MNAKRFLLTGLLLLLPIAVIAQGADEELIAAAKKGDVAAVKAALSKGANINARTNYGATPLHFAADRGHLEVIRVLADAGADTNAKDDFYKMTPIMMAMTHSQKEAVALLQKISVEKKNAELAAKSAQAAPTPQSSQSAQPADQPAKLTANPALNDELISAAKRGELAKVKELLAKGAEVNARTRYNQTPLMLAAQQGHTEIVKLLLEAKADPDVVDSFYKSMTALSVSAERGHAEIVKLLLDKGAKGKENALVIASVEGRKPIVEHLLKLGLNQQILDTALARATDAEQKEIADLLKTAGAKLAEKKSLKPEIKIDEATLQKYAGNYRIDEARQYTFIIKDGKLSGWDVRQYSFAITAVETNVFRFGNDDTRTLTFNEENGKVVSVTLNQNGFKQTYNRVEGK